MSGKILATNRKKEPQEMRTQFATAAALAFALTSTAVAAQTSSYPQTPGQQTAPGAQSQMNSQAASATPVTSLSDAQTKLASATVKDSQGNAVGRVQSVQTSTGGMVQAVKVALTSGKRTVAIPASSLNYDSSNGTVQASMTKTEIDSLPASKGS